MTTTADIRDRLSRGHATAAEAHRRGRDAKLAATFRPDARQERLLELSRTDRAAFDRLPATTRVSLGHYLETKAAHGREEATR